MACKIQIYVVDEILILIEVIEEDINEIMIIRTMKMMK